MKQYIIFDLEEEEYAISIEEIESINRIQSITRVPKSPYYINGVINVRGDIIPVMSLRKKLDFYEDVFTNSTRIIIIKKQDASIAIIVDKVKEVIGLDSKNIESFQETNSKMGADFIKGVGKINNRIVTIINIGKLIENIEDELCNVMR
ncbi:MAG TPA: chemotaxis protein CheW [Clostridiales bacterium]|nr:chemotaxis protein CheW [Clostridiales bacterium]